MTAMRTQTVSVGGLGSRPQNTEELWKHFQGARASRNATPNAERHIQAHLIAPIGATEQSLGKRRTAPWSEPPSPSRANMANAYGRVRPPESHRLTEALAELAELDETILEEGLPKISKRTKDEAKRLIRILTRRAPARALLAIYPTEDAEIALHFKAPNQTGTVILLLRDDGQADCYAYIRERSRDTHYGTSLDLPDPFLLNQLRDLEPDDIEAATLSLHPALDNVSINGLALT